jgi:primosomal replication protein N
LSGANRLEISGTVAELKGLRHTPAGIPVVEFRIRHESERQEGGIQAAGALRKISVEVEAIAFETLARLVAKSEPGRKVKAEGFLCARSRRSRKPVLHVTHIEFE